MDTIIYNCILKYKKRKPTIREIMRYAKHYRKHMETAKRAIELSKSLNWI